MTQAREEAREQAVRERDRIAMLEREIAELRRGEPPPPRRARTPSTPPIVKATTAQPIDELSQRGPAVSGPVLFAVILLAGAVIGALMWFLILRPEMAAPVVDTCEIRSEPPYADVIGMRRGEEIKLGIAPVAMTFDGWREYSRIVLRLPGHDDVIVETPSAITCPTDAVQLTRR